MSARLDQLASDLKTLRALILETVEKQSADKPAPIRGAREHLVMEPRLWAGSALSAVKRPFMELRLRAESASSAVKRLFMELRLRAGSALSAVKQSMGTWSRSLRPIGSGGPTYFPDLSPEKSLAPSKRRKDAGILTGIALAAFGTFIVSAVIFVQFSASKVEVAGLKRDLAGTTEKIAALEANIVAARRDPKEVREGTTARKLASAGETSQPLLALTHDEVKLIRDFIKVPPPPVGAAQSINVGDLLPDAALTPLPDPIMKKVPKLVGARFTVDRNSAIVVVAPATNRADVVINAN
jgi:hypothetical protein